MVSVHGAPVHRPISIRYLSVPKRALRLIYFSTKPRDHAISFFIESNCLPLQSLFFQQLSYLMYDVHAKTAPESSR